MSFPNHPTRNIPPKWPMLRRGNNLIHNLTNLVAAPSLQVFIAFFLALFVSGCSAKKTAGVKKDFTTGLTATYSNMEPESVLLMMNNEVLNHTDIPIGESFVLINENVTGMKVKEGKVSAGCSLRISDENGTILLEEKDVFAKDEATRLKCTINTGSPMEWEKNYKIQVVFWDKYGDGKIVNECTIRSIDIP